MENGPYGLPGSGVAAIALTGCLGAGKTSLLNHLPVYEHRAAAYILMKIIFI